MTNLKNVKTKTQLKKKKKNRSGLRSTNVMLNKTFKLASKALIQTKRPVENDFFLKVHRSHAVIYVERDQVLLYY